MRPIGVAIAVALAASAAPAGEPASVSAGAEGFALRSADGAYVLKIRGYVQLDGTFFAHDEAGTETDTFQIRRARPILEGTLARFVDFRIMPDFGQGKSALYDAYVDLRFHPLAKVRAGKYKPPVGLERLQSATDILFVTRAAPTLLVPSRDVGVQLHGEWREGVLAYAVMVGNGTPDGTSADVDVNDEKEVAARLFALPFRSGGPEMLRGLGFGIAGSRGKSRGTASVTGLPTFKTPGDLPFFTFRSDGTAAGTAVADGLHARLTPQAYWYVGRVSVIAEHVTSSQEVGLGASSATIENSASQLAVGVLLTPDRSSYRGVTPAKPFAPGATGTGAIELAARWSRLDVDPDAFPTFADPAKSARRAVEWAVGVNWYATRNVRLTLDLDRTAFDGGGPEGADRATETVALGRIQVSF